MSRCQPWVPDWTWPDHQWWPGQRHPWADLDPLGRDRRRPPLPAFDAVERVLAPAHGLRVPCRADHSTAVLPAGLRWWARGAYATHLAAVLPRFPEPDSPPPPPQRLLEILEWSAQQMRDQRTRYWEEAQRLVAQQIREQAQREQP